VIESGETYQLPRLETRSAGTLTDADALPTVSIVKPDGTIASPAPTAAHAGVGLYDASYTTAAPGLHGYVWSAAISAQPVRQSGTFYVDAASFGSIVSLQDARLALPVMSTANDELLRAYLVSATDTCEEHTGLTWRRTTITSELHDGGTWYVRLRKAPVLSITTVTVFGSAITDYTLNPRTGNLYRGTSLYPSTWATGRQNIATTYVAGPADGIIPGPIRDGVTELVRHRWDQLRGGTGLPRESGTDDTWNPSSGFYVPNRVREMWDPYRWVPVA
jgi:hypothetical protein